MSSASVDGHDAVVFAEQSVLFASWVDGAHAFRLDGHNFESEDDFRAVLATVKAVDQRIWYAALPEGTVLPDGRP